MTYKGYEAYITIDEQAGIMHGEIINLRDVITFQGKSVRELKKALADSVEDYLAFCKERGEEAVHRRCVDGVHDSQDVRRHC